MAVIKSQNKKDDVDTAANNTDTAQSPGPVALWINAENDKKQTNKQTNTQHHAGMA